MATEVCEPLFSLLLQIALGTVTNVEEAVKWLSYTYLYVRMRANPLVYGINHKASQVGPDPGRAGTYTGVEKCFFYMFVSLKCFRSSNTCRYTDTRNTKFLNEGVHLVGAKSRPTRPCVEKCFPLKLVADWTTAARRGKDKTPK